MWFLYIPDYATLILCENVFRRKVWELKWIVLLDTKNRNLTIEALMFWLLRWWYAIDTWSVTRGPRTYNSRNNNTLLPTPKFVFSAHKSNTANNLPKFCAFSLWYSCLLSDAEFCVLSVQEDMALITNLVYYYYFNMAILMILQCVPTWSCIGNAPP